MSKAAKLKGGHHEMSSRADATQMGSDRAFGLTFAVVAGLVCAFLAWHGSANAFVAGGVALAFLGAALVMPFVLRPLNVVWFRFGLLLHAVTTPIVLSVLFFITVTPIGLIMRVFGKTPLQLRPTEAESYWSSREAAAPQSSLKTQF